MNQNPDITYFAKTNFRDERNVFGIKQKDRENHTYIIGKTSTGKTNLLKTKILQDIKFNRGLCLFDIHGDLIDEIQHLLPQRIKEDVVFHQLSSLCSFENSSCKSIIFCPEDFAALNFSFAFSEDIK